jgi:hypothetical protein
MKNIKTFLLEIFILTLVILSLFTVKTYAQGCTAEGGGCFTGLSCCSGVCTFMRCTAVTTTTSTTTTASTTTTTTTLPSSFNYNFTVNFGINNSSAPWVQTECGDLRIDSGISNPIPASPVCGSSSGAYASLRCEGGGTPGIIFGGTSNSDFGQGQASQPDPTFGFDWLVDGTFSDIFNAAVSKKTSVAVLLSRLAQMNITPTDLHTVPGCSDYLNCKLPENLPTTGLVYIAHDNLTLITDDVDGTLNLGEDQVHDYIIIVQGDLNIKEKIKVKKGSTAIFAAKNINIESTVGEVDPCPPGDQQSDIEGWFFADGDFTVLDDGNACPTPDYRLNIAGSVIAGAVGGGSFVNERDLCADNANSPSVFLEERIDFILNAPQIIKTSTYTWQEVAP